MAARSPVSRPTAGAAHREAAGWSLTLTADYLDFVPPPERVLDAGPIAYADIDLYGDPDLEHALLHEGLDPQTTTYRLIEIPLSSINDTSTMPWPRMSTIYVEAIKEGQQFPPLVVFRGQQGWWLLDGVNRTQAYFLARIEYVRAYELLIT